MIAAPGSDSLAALEARLEALTSRRTALHARVAVLDVGIGELARLVGEVAERISRQEAEVARLMVAAGTPIMFGNDYSQPTVVVRYGGEAVQLSGPRPLDTPRGALDHARRVYDALQAEAQPVRAALSALERERAEAAKAAGLLGGEIEGVEQQIARVRAEEAERAELIGERLPWRDRLAAILRRLMHGTPAPTVQELRAEGKSLREIEAITGISKSEVARRLSAAVPGGTPDQSQTG